ncbi:MAG: hypothetical protein GC193_01030 [Cryomorphaceae bacterium]|nr:hypothetical protein [Cryomorphaceae bacterium]
MFQSIKHIVFPHACVACGSRLPNEQHYLCLRCELQLPQALMPTGIQPLEPVFWGRLLLQGAFSNYHFTRGSTVQKMMHTLKYGGDPRVAYHFGRQFGLRLKKLAEPPLIDIIVPVPLHPKKERKRGYNQATWIAKGIADILEVDVQQALERVEHKKSLTTLNRIERWKQSGELYRNSGIDITGKRLLLVDDVVTTGSTLDSCGNILMEKEPQALYIGALAQAMKRY